MIKIHHKLAKLIISGTIGSLTQGLLMFGKKYFNILPEFEPFREIQRLLGEATFGLAPSYLTLLATFINGALILSYLFGKIYDRLPSRHGLIKGAAFGVLGWLLFNTLLFPMIGYGFFISRLNLGPWPSCFSFLMIETYSLSLAFAYSKLIKRKF